MFLTYVSKWHHEGEVKRWKEPALKSCCCVVPDSNRTTDFQYADVDIRLHSAVVLLSWRYEIMGVLITLPQQNDFRVTNLFAVGVCEDLIKFRSIGFCLYVPIIYIFFWHIALILKILQIKCYSQSFPNLNRVGPIDYSSWQTENIFP